MKLLLDYKLFIPTALIASMAVAACDQTETKVMPAVTDAVAVIYPTDDYRASGVITLKQEQDHLNITGTLSGLAPGEHGFHIHEKGDCSGGDGKAAGGHFNPYDTRHAGPAAPERHVGDLGNITADTSGVAGVNLTDALATLNVGLANILGRAFVVHAGADDFTSQPSGAAGDRVGCGVIGQK